MRLAPVPPFSLRTQPAKGGHCHVQMIRKFGELHHDALWLRQKRKQEDSVAKESTVCCALGAGLRHVCLHINQCRRSSLIYLFLHQRVTLLHCLLLKHPVTIFADLVQSTTSTRPKSIQRTNLHTKQLRSPQHHSIMPSSYGSYHQDKGLYAPRPSTGSCMSYSHSTVPCHGMSLTYNSNIVSQPIRTVRPLVAQLWRQGDCRRTPALWP